MSGTRDGAQPAISSARTSMESILGAALGAVRTPSTQGARRRCANRGAARGGASQTRYTAKAFCTSDVCTPAAPNPQAPREAAPCGPFCRRRVAREESRSAHESNHHAARDVDGHKCGTEARRELRAWESRRARRRGRLRGAPSPRSCTSATERPPRIGMPVSSSGAAAAATRSRVRRALPRQRSCVKRLRAARASRPSPST